MPVKDSNDKELRQIIFENEKVIVKFIDENCPVCKILAPSFLTLAANPLYQHITFLRMAASENPVSSKEVKMSGTPFFASYKDGTLFECGILSGQSELEEMLKRLLVA